MDAQTTGMMDTKEVNIGLDQEGRKHVADALSGFLASTYTLYMKALYYHWNVTGPHFHSLHELFEQHYQDLHEAGDELAERIRALGHFTPGTFQAYAEMSSVKEDDVLPKDSKHMVKNLLKGHETCSQEARKVLKIAEEAEDEVTVDMMVARMSTHEEAAWMLRSTIE